MGIRTIAVAMRLSKGFSYVKGKRNYNHREHRVSQRVLSCVLLCPLWLSFYDFSRVIRVVVVEPAIPPFPLLIFGDSLQQVNAAKIRP